VIRKLLKQRFDLLFGNWAGRLGLQSQTPPLHRLSFLGLLNLPPLFPRCPFDVFQIQRWHNP